MKLEYSLEKNDYVTFHLFAASQSPRIIGIRKNRRLLFPLIYLGFSIVSYFIEGLGLALIFFIIGLSWFLFYPFYERKRYIKHYEKFIDENHKNRFGKIETLEFEEEYILSKDYTGEAKLFISEIEELNEIKDYFFLKFNSGVSLIIPKSSINNLDQMNQYLKALILRLNRKHNIDLAWRWK